MSEITFTLDLEDHQPDHFTESNYASITKNVLSALLQRNAHATIFVLGELAYNNPELIEYIADKGHEVAYHSYRHTPLIHEDPSRFMSETDKFKNYIHEICGVEVKGFRAPVFSLTNKTTWVLDSLKQLGFVYSSSVLPGGSPLYGFPDAPKHPFKWGNGIIELPAPIHNIGPVALPFLGGIYFRYIPLFLIKQFVKSMSSEIMPWIYCHPHDFDYKQPYFRILETSHLVSLLLWFNRKNTNSKLFNLLDSGVVELEKRSLLQQVEDGKFDSVPVFLESI
jgi:polysaccharide deacetylase family protein (PEP-CTERM system associated)